VIVVLKKQQPGQKTAKKRFFVFISTNIFSLKQKRRPFQAAVSGGSLSFAAAIPFWLSSQIFS
jgi:hypothetical protein